MEEREQERLKASIARLEKETAMQKRELEMEAALEKVRSAANAMQTSDELLKVITIVGQQLEKLGLEFDSTNFRTNVGEKDWHLWIYAKWMDQPRQWFIPKIDHPYFSIYEKEGEVVSHVFSREEKDSFEAYLFQLGLIEIPKDPDVAAKQKEFMEAAQGFAWAIASIKSVSLNIANSRAKPYTQEENALLLRFTIAFEQAYTRFLGLQKAEAQAREAQIEAALERVRSQSMAMHKSGDLLDVISVLSNQLLQLGFKIDSANFNTSYREKDWNLWLCNPGRPMYPDKIHVPYLDHPYFNRTIESLANGSDFNSFVFSKAEKDTFLDHLFSNTIAKDTQEELKKTLYDKRGFAWSVVYLKNTCVTIANYDAEPYTEEQNVILRRFGNAFEQSYTRFLDLQKAEAQAREAQIEAALERVRSRSMAMYKSDELATLSFELVKQVQLLGVPTWYCAFNIYDEEQKNSLEWGSNSEGTYPNYRVPRENIFLRYYEAGQRGETLLINEIGPGECAEHYRYLCGLPGVGEQLLKIRDSGIPFPESQIDHVAYFKYGYILFITFEPAPESHDIFKRFAKIFEQTYTRFLDLQKAEAQAREAQIEAALERVRSRTIAMHQSDELLEVINVISEQLQQLKFRFSNVSFAANNQEYDFSFWLASKGQTNPFRIHVPYFDNPAVNRVRDAQKNGVDFFTDVLTPEENHEWLSHIIKNSVLKETSDETKKYLLSRGGFARSMVLTKYISFTIGNFAAVPYSEEENAIFKRFAYVFEQSYTRFLDLQKAEAQAREAKIEAGLERVRYSAMAMQSSEDVGSATAVVFNEISLLGVETMRCGITIIHPDKTADVWAATATSEGKEMKGMGSINFDDHPLWVGLFDAWKNKEENFTYALKGDDLKSYYQILTSLPSYNSSYIQNQEFPDHIFYAGFFEQGAVFTFSMQPHDDEKRKILKRFTAVFSLTFRRYLDLKQAEAQTREAEIQLALERVRARTMAMQRSEELAETCGLLFEEFRKLRIVKTGQEGTAADRTTIGIFNEAERTYDLSVTNLEGKKLDHTFRLSMDEPINIAKVYAAWKEGKPLLVIDMHGDDLNQWLNYLQALGLPINTDLYDKRRINIFAFFSKGSLGITANEPLPEESLHLLQRFADTFSLTYTRFQDLKDAEARTQIAVKEASLDRVRAGIASMRTAEDLQHITPLVWRELTTLGVPFFRCGVFIVDDEKQMIHFYLSAPDGKPLAALELGFDGAAVTKNATAFWRKQKVYTTHWTKEEFLQFAKDLISQGQIQNVQTYQGGEDAPESLTLQFVPFAQGMMYVGSLEDLSAAQIELVQILADAFSTAYARYEDFNRLEAAKQQIESTLKDLRATQTQLIQSEKMASLGELTAGIAHEIQNPLNFVNNFSEVNMELIEEVISEKSKVKSERDEKLVDELLNDIVGNLEKINHHGKRADAIVKGMLQHSRSSSGVKEPTDINALADEYLRLAYHGLRAKDKSFNATMVTHFDPAISKINVVPQDIGRVVLNLITNAFYAVNDKKKKGIMGYEPTVTVSTGYASASGNPLIRQFANSLVISVKDNGMGLPEKVKEKIFQPFFTTKPTGEGTGLGLSMSYDIVTKGHGGELLVQSEEGVYAEFSIVLPA